MRSQLGSFIRQLTNFDWDVRVETGGNLPAGTKSFEAQLVNRVGRNLLSPTKTVTYENGNKIIVVIPASIILPGEDVWKILISGHDTDNNQDAVQLVEIDYRGADGIPITTLPIEIELTESAHIETVNLTVPTAASLPSGSDLINGQVRTVEDEGDKLYRYQELTDTWVEHYFDSPYTYIGNTKDTGGSDQELGADLIISPLPIEGDSEPITTTPIRYWLVNGEDETEGTTLNGSFNLRVSVNGATVSDTGKVWGNVFAGLFKFQLIGYYRLLTRAIDTGMETVGVTQSWHPTYNLLSLPINLPAGYAAVYDLWLEADLPALSSAGFNDGDTLSISFDPLGRVGIPSDLAALTGDVIFGEGNRLKVLPNKILAGKGIAGGFFFDIPSSEAGIFNSVPPNTPNQVVIINGATGGTVRTAAAPAALLSSEVIRCTFSTEAGFTNPSEFSDILTLTNASGLSVTINHPVGTSLKATIRADYLDPTIAGNSEADWDNPSFRQYVLKGSTLYEKNTLETSNGSSSQTLEIFNLDDFTQVDFIADGGLILGADFGLFKPGKPALAELPGGTLEPNNYQVAVRYEYPAPNYKITRLRHDVEGVIKELPQTFSDLLSTYKRWSDTILTLAEARSLDNSKRTPLSIWLIADLGYAPYILRLDINGSDDGRNIIKFNSGVGGFIPLKTLGMRFATNTALLDTYSLVRISTGLIATEDIAGRAINIRLDEGAIAPVEVRSNLIDEQGNILLADNTNLLVAP